MARSYAENNYVPFIEVKADWSKYGRAAGPLRNTKMLKMKPNLVIAFSSKDELTPGTRDTVTKAKKLGIKVRVIYSDE